MVLIFEIVEIPLPNNSAVCRAYLLILFGEGLDLPQSVIFVHDFHISFRFSMAMARTIRDAILDFRFKHRQTIADVYLKIQWQRVHQKKNL